MDWITGIQNAINYIEDHLAEPIDYNRVARESFSSPFHFQRVFSILCGYTLGEYIRFRRLTLAGTELATGSEKVIDIAAKYGYDSPDSFARAFQKFHGITPSQARSNGAMLRSFSRLSLKISLEGGNMMNYRIEKKEALVLTGYKARFTGTPMKRDAQDHNFICGSRLNQAVLHYMAHDVDTSYNVLTNFDDTGYDFYEAALIGKQSYEMFEDEMGSELFSRFEQVTIPAGTYLVCQTERCMWPCDLRDDLYRQAVSEWLPSSGYLMTDGPSVEVVHWYYKENDDAYNSTRYMELWLPIAKA